MLGLMNNFLYIKMYKDEKKKIVKNVLGSV